jgi:inosose dehydratase
MSVKRRDFIRLAGAGALAAGMPAVASVPVSMPEGHANDKFKLAIAGYTFLKVGIDDALAMMKRVNINLLGIKDFQLPYNSSDEAIAAFVAKLKDNGVTPYGVGVVYMKSEAEVDRAFEYAKTVGVNLIVGAPNVDLLPYVEKKVMQYDIRLGIHNHGPDNPLYSSPDDVWASVRDLDPRMGFCIDIGHTTRLGQDPVALARKYHNRVYDFHVWDTDQPVKAGKCVEAGRGIIDFPAFFKTLRQVGYSGTVSLEYTKDMNDPLAGIAESIGYFHGVLDG